MLLNHNIRLSRSWSFHKEPLSHNHLLVVKNRHGYSPSGFHAREKFLSTRVSVIRGSGGVQTAGLGSGLWQNVLEIEALMVPNAAIALYYSFKVNLEISLHHLSDVGKMCYLRTYCTDIGYFTGRCWHFYHKQTPIKSFTLSSSCWNIIHRTIMFVIFSVCVWKYGYYFGSIYPCCIAVIVIHSARDQWPLLLTWFNFNPCMDKLLHAW